MGVTLNGGTLLANGTFSTYRPITMTAASTLDVTSGNTYTTNAIMGGFGLTKGTGAGTLVLNGVGTFGGAANGMVINGGTVSISQDANLGNVPTYVVSNNLVINGGTLAATATFTLSTNRGIALGATSGTVHGHHRRGGGPDADLRRRAGQQRQRHRRLAVSVAGTSNILTPAIVYLSGTNTFTGGTTIGSGAEIQYSADAAMGVTGTGTKVTVGLGGIAAGPITAPSSATLPRAAWARRESSP